MKIRNKTENYKYIERLEDAIDQIKQAIDNITYMAYPEINQRTAARLREAICIMDESLDKCIFKP